jgi:hypothetical protein
MYALRPRSTQRRMVGIALRAVCDGALEVEVRVVLPGEADPAVDLDVLGRAAEEGLGAGGLGERRRDGELCHLVLRHPGRPVGRRARRLDLEQHVGLCFTAWKVPIGRPNCTRTLA